MVKMSFNNSPPLKASFGADGNINAKFGKTNEIVTSDHNKLNNRDLSDQHPMEAISGLIEKLDEIKDKSFVFTKRSAEDIWEIRHDLNKMPSVIVQDSAGNTVMGEIEYIDENNVRLIFNGAFSGKAYLN